ncbi:MAG: DNA repair protein RecN [Erysipelotrichaceae bacterium]|nr:DNA repair protein RecN [Erysipelotrichaceae bacterium]
MLKSLYIKNYAIIDELELQFSDGFTVFTGETGAGKSIIVGALSYLIKGKADVSVIRNGAQKAIIEGIFSIDDYMKEKLDEADIEYDDELIIRRVISRDNHNSIKINQVSVTLAFLTDLFDEHIDIHSQRDSQYLLNKKNHLSLLDRYCDDETQLFTYKEAYKAYKAALKEYDELTNNTYSERELEFIRFDLNELKEANIDIEEEADLQAKEKRYKSAEKYITTLNSAIELYDGDSGIKEQLSTLLHGLNLDDEVVNSVKENIESIYYDLNDETDRLKDLLAQFTDEDFNIEYIEERLYTYSKLKRKHATDTEGLLEKQKELSDKIALFDDREYVLSEKKKQLDQLYNEAHQKAEVLHEIRQKKAKDLENSVVRHCQDLILPNTRFSIRIDETDLNNNGIDDIEFYVSMNKGEELKPLKNAASGGEISRLMLAMKAVFTSLSETSLAIFDEIDTGVSGKVALAIGLKIASIARSAQVLCISHLAAVAACAKEHFYIYKNDEAGYSNTSVRKLDEKQIIEELAMISTSETSASAIEAARTLYESAQAQVRK